jgi:hypothetical protein
VGRSAKFIETIDGSVETIVIPGANTIPATLAAMREHATVPVSHASAQSSDQSLAA